MKAYLLAFMLFLFGVSESSVSIPEEGIVRELLGEKAYAGVVNAPQFQEEVFAPQTEVVSDEIKNFDQEIAKEDQDSKSEVFEEQASLKNKESADDLEKKETVENSKEEHHEEIVSEDQESEKALNLEKEYRLSVEFDPTKCINPACFQEEEPAEKIEHCFDYSDPYCDPLKLWYFTLKPGYFYFKDNDMRHFFDGGFTFRAETGRRFWDHFMVWIDGGYFKKKGSAIGGPERLKIQIATITLGLKGIYYFNSWSAAYAGLGPRLFMMLLHNSSPHVRSDDNEIGIGGGFTAGLWFFPTYRWENLYLDFFADYSMKKLKVEPDEISSIDNDVDVSGLTAGVGIGFRF